MKAFLERWAPWLAAAVLVAGVVSFAVVKLTGSSSTSPPPHRASRLSAAELNLAYSFLDTAVARKDLGRAWGLVTPELKQDMSLAEWKTGTIPVVPYPVSQANVGMSTVESFTDTASLHVAFTPRPHTAASPATFTLDLQNVHGRWLVSGWQPSSTVAPHSGK